MVLGALVAGAWVVGLTSRDPPGRGLGRGCVWGLDWSGDALLSDYLAWVWDLDAGS